MTSRALSLAVLVVLSSAIGAPAQAATGCDLNFPDRDVPRLVPGATGFKSRYHHLTAVTLQDVVSRLGGNYRVLYEPLDVPYSVYEVFAGDKQVGYIHGVNHKGQYGGIQLFIAQEMTGGITVFYIQKMTSPVAGKFRDPAFGKRFIGVRLGDFDRFDPVSGKGSGRLAQIANPAPEAQTDFYSVLRALKKNLVLMDQLVFSAKPGPP